MTTRRKTKGAVAKSRAAGVSTTTRPEDIVLTPMPEASDGYGVPEVIEDGDYAGMTYDDVLKYTVEGVHDALGELTVEGAACAIDQVMKEVLLITQNTSGDRAAKEAGINFCKTALPFAMLDISDEPGQRSLKDARRDLVTGSWGLPDVSDDN